MIKINNKEYKCLQFTYNRIEDVEHLHIVINGELDISVNKLNITYYDRKYYGCKILPQKHNGGFMSFLVYIFQEGDSEAWKNQHQKY